MIPDLITAPIAVILRADFLYTMDITLTETAATRIHDYLSQQPDAVGLRLGVKRTGCSGWAYVVGLAENVADGDQVFEDRGIRIVVDQDSVDFVKGTRIDFIKDGLNELFRFDNPNVVDECGCGESFNV